MIISIVIKTIVIISNLLIQITPNLCRLEQTSCILSLWIYYIISFKFYKWKIVNSFYSLAIVKSLTKLYNKHNKRDSKPYWFAPTVYFFKSKTTVLAIQWFFNTYFFLLFRKRVIICMIISIVIKTIVIVSNLLIQITPNLFRLEQTSCILSL